MLLHQKSTHTINTAEINRTTNHTAGSKSVQPGLKSCGKRSQKSERGQSSRLTQTVSFVYYIVWLSIYFWPCAAIKNVSWHNTKTQSKCQKYITSIGGYFIHTYAGFLTICCTLYWKIFYIDSAAQTLISLVHQGQCVNNEDSREMKEENIKVGVELKLL